MDTFHDSYKSKMIRAVQYRVSELQLMLSPCSEPVQRTIHSPQKVSGKCMGKLVPIGVDAGRGAESRLPSFSSCLGKSVLEKIMKIQCFPRLTCISDRDVASARSDTAMNMCTVTPLASQTCPPHRADLRHDARPPPGRGRRDCSHGDRHWQMISGMHEVMTILP